MRMSEGVRLDSVYNMEKGAIVILFSIILIVVISITSPILYIPYVGNRSRASDYIVVLYPPPLMGLIPSYCYG